MSGESEVGALMTRARGEKVTGPVTARHPSLASPVDPVAASRTVVIPRRELVTLRAYLITGSHAEAAHSLGISESTSRQRVSLLMRRVGARNAAQAVWMLRQQLERETARPIASDRMDAGPGDRMPG